MMIARVWQECGIFFSKEPDVYKHVINQALAESLNCLVNEIERTLTNLHDKFDKNNYFSENVYSMYERCKMTMVCK